MFLISETFNIDAVPHLRQTCKAKDDKHDDELFREIPGVTRVDNLSYGPNPKRHLLKLCLP